MRHLKQKVVGIGMEAMANFVPERKRADFDRKVEEAHRKGYLTNQMLDELTSEETKVEEDPFPDMSPYPLEVVTKKWFDWEQKKWEQAVLKVRIHPEKFAEGGMRAAHFMVIAHPDDSEERMVAKRQRDPEQIGESYYHTDVVMQSCCQAVAKAFNERNPVKKVEFVDCFIIQRTDGTWWGVETYMKGKYIKYNNNFGYVGKDARNTPQAFSHFSYEFTQGKLMIVDIQGVGDHYTDPQVHTMDGKGFGMGNLGQRGIDRFMKTHWCNSICAYLNLQFHAPKKFGVAWHKSPKRDGTNVVGQVADAEGMKMADFISDIQPKKGSATPEDLALLGLTEKQFTALAAAFNDLDKDNSGYLDKQELFQLFQKARVANTKSEEAEEFVNFVNRIESQVDNNGKVSFKSFVLCWTDNV